jgi:phosphate transport system substrate-binding protein
VGKLILKCLANPISLRLLACPVLAIAFFGALVGMRGAAAEEVTSHGSSTVMNAIVATHQSEIESRSGQKLRVVGNGSQRGIADLVAGRAQIAMISAPLAVEIKKLNQNTPSAIDPEKFNEYQIGESRVAFAVHPSNTVRALKNRLLTDILMARLTNWNEVGGADQEIIIVTAQPGDGLRSMVEAKLLGDTELPSNARSMTNATQIAKVVSQLPGAIGIIAPASINGSLVELHVDQPIAQPLILVTMGAETSEVRRVIEAAIAVGKLLCTHTPTRETPEFPCSS